MREAHTINRYHDLSDAILLLLHEKLNETLEEVDFDTIDANNPIANKDLLESEMDDLLSVMEYRGLW
jgi:hypothetical protein